MVSIRGTGNPEGGAYLLNVGYGATVIASSVHNGFGGLAVSGNTNSGITVTVSSGVTNGRAYAISLAWMNWNSTVSNE